MAQVDFSNAVLDAYSTYKPMNASYLVLWNRSLRISGGGSGIANISAHNVLTNTPTKVSILFAGEFTSRGTEFYIETADLGEKYWKVSNVSFNDGDAFSFVIDIEVSGNT